MLAEALRLRAWNLRRFTVAKAAIDDYPDAIGAVNREHEPSHPEFPTRTIRIEPRIEEASTHASRPDSAPKRMAPKSPIATEDRLPGSDPERWKHGPPLSSFVA